jgi:hypothetical protein
VPKTPELLDALNDINARIVGGRLFWSEQSLMFAISTFAENVQAAELQVSISLAAAVFAEYSNQLQDAFGGERPFGY